jgi:hypothetical protein
VLCARTSLCKRSGLPYLCMSLISSEFKHFDTVHSVPNAHMLRIKSPCRFECTNMSGASYMKYKSFQIWKCAVKHLTSCCVCSSLHFCYQVLHCETMSRQYPGQMGAMHSDSGRSGLPNRFVQIIQLLQHAFFVSSIPPVNLCGVCVPAPSVLCHYQCIPQKYFEVTDQKHSTCRCML